MDDSFGLKGEIGAMRAINKAIGRGQGEALKGSLHGKKRGPKNVVLIDFKRFCATHRERQGLCLDDFGQPDTSLGA